MPVTNYLPSSRLVQPGVCTSTTRPVTPFEGQVIYETDTDKTLVWNGANWVFLSTSSAGDVGLVKIIPTVSSVGGTAATVSSDGVVNIGSGNTSITVTAFSSAFENYRVLCTNGSCSTQLQIRLQLSGISSNYFGAYNGTSYTASTYYGQNDNNGPHWTWVGTGGTGHMILDADITSPFITSRKFIHAKTSYIWAGNAYGFYIGECTSSASSTGFILTPSTGSFSSGSIRVYGYRN